MKSSRMNTETMNLYPSMGQSVERMPRCIQIPIFWGFYSMLGSAIQCATALSVGSRLVSGHSDSYRRLPHQRPAFVMAGPWSGRCDFAEERDAMQQRMLYFMRSSSCVSPITLSYSSVQRPIPSIELTIEKLSCPIQRKAARVL